jgi:hypothetical protein
MIDTLYYSSANLIGVSLEFPKTRTRKQRLFTVNCECETSDVLDFRFIPNLHHRMIKTFDEAEEMEATEIHHHSHRQPTNQAPQISSNYNTVVFESASERTTEAKAVHMIAIQLPIKAKPKTDLFGFCRYEKSEIRAWRTWLHGEYGWELERPPEALNQAIAVSGKGGLTI